MTEPGSLSSQKDEAAYDRAFSLYENKGYMISTGEAREKALAKVGYTEIVCPHCNGTGEG